MILIILATLGLCLSLYAWYVERAIAANPAYKPACDINDRISCSKALQSPYSTLFLVSNSVAGIVYYALIILITLFGYYILTPQMLHFALTALIASGALVSIGLAYILYFKIKTICLVCTSLYIINGLLLLARIV